MNILVGVYGSLMTIELNYLSIVVIILLITIILFQLVSLGTQTAMLKLNRLNCLVVFVWLFLFCFEWLGNVVWVYYRAFFHIRSICRFNFAAICELFVSIFAADLCSVKR